VRGRFLTNPNYRAGEIVSSDALAALAAGERHASDAERQWLIDLYDAEIATVDAALAELLEGVAKLGYGENTVTVVVSDHGEALGERESYFHGLTLHAETLRVPLLFNDSRAPTRGVRREEPVDLLDVAPTLLALAGAANVPGMRGRNLFVAGGDALPSRDLFAELHPDPPFENYVAPRLQRLSLLRWPWKAIALREDGPLVYRVDRDPMEQVAMRDGVPQELPAELDRLVEIFDRLLAATPAPAAPLSEETRQGLRALGYAE
jgi:choline-sulfatase